MTTMYLGLSGLSLSNAPSVSPLAAPTFRDAFDSGSNINGRTGWTVGYLSGSSAQANAITISSGKAGGTTGTGMFAGTSASIGLPVVKRRMNIGPVPGQTLIDHATLTTTGVTGFVFDVVNSSSGKLLNAVVNYRKYVNNTLTSLTPAVAQPAGRALAGDNIRTAYRVSGSDTVVDIFHNGWTVLSGTIVSGYSVPFTGNSGIKGNIGASALDEIEVADSTSQAWIALRWGTRVQARNSDGSVTLNVCVAYGQTAPSTLVYTVYDLNTGSEVALTGHDSVRVSTTNTDSYSRFTVNVAAALLTSGGPFVMKVVRDRLLAGGESVAWSPQWRVGLVCLSGGQSLNVGVSTNTFTTTDSYTPPSNSQHTLGAPANVSTLGAENTRYTAQIDTNCPVTAWQAAFAAGGYAVATASGGVSAQAIAARGVGTASHNALKECLDRHNRRANFIAWMDGQSDVSGDASAYAEALLAISQDLETYCGYIVPIQIDPVAASWYSTSFHDIRWQLMRQTQWKLCQDYPTRFFYGAHTLDIQHDTGTNGILHLSANGYGVAGTRRGKRSQKLLSLISHDPNGPSLASVSKVSATEIRCVYDLNGWDSLELVNTSYASDFNGGMIFSTAPTLNSTTIATKIAATGATVDGAPSGGQQGINFTFPGSTFTGSAYVWAAYGMNPFNPADNGTTTDPVNLDLAGKASMIRGVKSGELNTALQPYFTSDNLNYLVAS